MTHVSEQVAQGQTHYAGAAYCASTVVHLHQLINAAVQARAEAGREFRISQPATRYPVPAGQAASQQAPSSLTAARRTRDDSEPLRPASSLKVIIVSGSQGIAIQILRI